jgi:hypothetical protein
VRIGQAGSTRCDTLEGRKSITHIVRGKYTAVTGRYDGPLHSLRLTVTLGPWVQLVTFFFPRYKKFSRCNQAVRNPSWHFWKLKAEFRYLQQEIKLSRHRHTGAKGERNYSCYSFLTSALDGGEWSASLLGSALARGKDPRYQSYRRVGGRQLVWAQRLEEKSFSY